MKQLYINVPRNATRTNTPLHQPLVSLDNGPLQLGRCSTWELLKGAGASEAEINRAMRMIEATGQAVLECTIAGADLKRILEPPDDLGKMLIDEAAVGRYA